MKSWAQKAVQLNPRSRSRYVGLLGHSATEIVRCEDGEFGSPMLSMRHKDVFSVVETLGETSNFSLP